VQGAAVAGYRVVTGGQTVFEVVADLPAQWGQDGGGRGVGQVRGVDFEHQLPERIGGGRQAVDDGAQRGKLGVGRRIGSRRGCEDIADGLVDYGTHRGRVEGLETAVGERGEDQ
jgi:hypothetical protein